MNLGPLMVDLQGLELQPDEREMLAHPLVGSVILFARNYADPEQLTRLVADIHAVRSPALIVGVDQEGGRVQRFRDGFSLLPPLRRIGHEFDSEPKAGLALARELGWLMAAELRAHGVDLSFAPCVDLDYGVSEVIGDRALHARAAVVGQLAVAYMHGMRDAGMAATAKHFPGHGAVVADSHHALPVDRRALVDMDADLAPYRLLIQNGLPGVMVAHVAYPAVEDVPASTSSRWIRGVLRGQMHFQGVVFADDMSMAGAASVGGIVERAGLALAAGCDVLPVCNYRPSVLALLDGLQHRPDPASALRLVRLRGKGQHSRDELLASAAWRHCRAALERCMKPPALSLS
ncbi:MAG: beta-N-acetylhexosaminidase [Steroidobacteraceae bacterium]|nr:beta-N-acetylhexosaminidase [Nevskiaceae bacterium]MCP5339651.1 beta-N-acetylhexosaminidase [Nevskiaceae bacterium]MCP5360696.1 beta-N-acetylhexosaminidase [Nevskiaceae bacterium]